MEREVDQRKHGQNKEEERAPSNYHPKPYPRTTIFSHKFASSLALRQIQARLWSPTVAQTRAGAYRLHIYVWHPTVDRQLSTESFQDIDFSTA